MSQLARYGWLDWPKCSSSKLVEGYPRRRGMSEWPELSSAVERGGGPNIHWAETCRPVWNFMTKRDPPMTFTKSLGMPAAPCLGKDRSTIPRACSVARERKVPCTFVAT